MNGRVNELGRHFRSKRNWSSGVGRIYRDEQLESQCELCTAKTRQSAVKTRLAFNRDNKEREIGEERQKKSDGCADTLNDCPWMKGDRMAKVTEAATEESERVLRVKLVAASFDE
jgi:hypothetical protein